MFGAHRVGDTSDLVLTDEVGLKVAPKGSTAAAVASSPSVASDTAQVIGNAARRQLLDPRTLVGA